MCQISRSQGSLKPISATIKSEVQIIADMATHVLGADDAINWQAMSEDFDIIRDYVAEAIEGFENFNKRVREADRGFHLYHPARHRVWETDSGKAQFEVPHYPITFVAAQMAEATADLQTGFDDNDKTNVSNAKQQVWQLTSVRSHDQFNTMIFGYKDRYRQTDRRDVLFMHPDEIKRLGWHKEDRVMVSRQDSHGQMRTLGPLVLTEMDIAANAVATYYPECNDLFDLDTLAPDSHIPAYKSSTVILERVQPIKVKETSTKEATQKISTQAAFA